jgi:S1-C subfamily serine protease
MKAHVLGRGIAATALGIPLVVAPFASPSAQAAAGQPDATRATDEQTTGVVLIDTVLDYGAGTAAGTGLVIGSSGLVVTNHHVVQDSTSITVTTPDGTQYSATVVGYDATHDVAVLHLDGATGLATVATDPTPVTQGEAIDAIGNAEGEGVLTDAPGVVTNPSTNITVTDDDGSRTRLTGLIESDADVVPGDSGGAWLDSDGEVVGMTVAASQDVRDITGYAIPIKRVLTIAMKIEAGRATRYIVIGTKAAIGIEVVSARRLLITAVDSPEARRAGLRPGDVVTKIGKTKVTTIAQLTKILARHEPGDTVRLTWINSAGAYKSARITLTAGPIA